MGLILGVFAAGLAGSVLALWSVATSCLEMHGLYILKLNGPKKLSAISNIVRDTFMLVVQIIVAYVGASVIIVCDEQAIPYRLAAWATVSTLLSLNLIVDRIRRIKVEQLYDQRALNHFHRRSTDAAPTTRLNP